MGPPRPSVAKPPVHASSRDSLATAGASYAHLRVVDLARSLAILGVVLVHAMPRRFMRDDGGAPIASMDAVDWLTFFFSALTLSTFFFVSGFLLAHTNGYPRAGGYFRFLRRKAARLMLPFAVFTAAAFGARALFGRFAAREVPITAEEFAAGLLYPAGGPMTMMWFLPALMGCFLFAPLAHWLRRAAVWRWVLVMAAFGAFSALHLLYENPGHDQLRAFGLLDRTPWSRLYRLVPNDRGGTDYYDLLSFSKTLYCLPFFLAGALAHRYRSAWNRLLSARWLASASVGALSAVTLVILFVAGPRLLLAGSVLGVLSSFSVAYRLARRRTGWLDTVGRHEYAIYLLSWFFQQAALVACLTAYRPLPPFPADARFWLTVALLFAAGVAGPVIFARFSAKWRVPGRALWGVRG